MDKLPKIGLALGSGGARGLAHIGVIKILAENGIPIDFIAGSSMGALIGGWYALTGDIKKIENVVLKITKKEIYNLFFDPSFHQGLIRGNKIKSFVENYVDGKKFEDCKIPFLAIATDFKTGETIFMDKGEISAAIRASISIPLIFTPVKIGDKLLTDGGLSLPVPTEAVKKMGADIVIAVNVDESYYDSLQGKKNKFSLYDIALRSIDLLRYHLALDSARGADVIITPRMPTIKWSQFTKSYNIITCGAKTTEKSLPKIKEIIKQWIEKEN